MLNQSKKVMLSHVSQRKSEIHISELGQKDVECSSLQLKALNELIVLNDDKYPGIDRWFLRKVVPGIRSGERRAYVIIEDDKPIAAAILKLGKSAKICHLRVSDSHRDADLGQVLLIHMAMDAIDYANEIHLTLPESLWATKSGFFESFGFAMLGKTSRHYRRNDTELACSAPVATVCSLALRKLTRLLSKYCLGANGDRTDVLMSVKPIFAERILAGSKHIEIRKRFSSRWVGHDAVLYATQPQGALVGRARIDSVITRPPEDVWRRFESGIGCSRAEFDAYVGAANTVSAIEFTCITPFEKPVPRSELSQLLHQKLTPPQSFFELKSEKTSNWMNAVYLARLLQRCSKTFR